MIKIGCAYAPKVKSVPITDFPKYTQVAELGNIFYRFLAKKDLDKLAKLPSKYNEFEFTVKMNRFITHKYQFRYPSLREKALETMEQMIDLTNSLKCNKILIQTHFTLEYDDQFFKNVRDFFNSIKLDGINLFWEIRGMTWRDKVIRQKLTALFEELDIGHTIDLLFSKPLNIIKDGIIYTRLHGFGAKWNNYLHKQEDLIRLIKEINVLLEQSKEVYVVFATEEMFNDATFLKNLWEDIKTNKVDLDKYEPALRNDFSLKYSYSGQNLNIIYNPPFAVSPEKDTIKISTRVMENMQQKIDDYVKIVDSLKSADKIDKKLETSYFEELRKLGEYLLKYLLGTKVNYRYRLTKNNSLVIETDQNSLAMPFELIHDGRDFVCLKNNVIRKYDNYENILPSSIENLKKTRNLKLLFLIKTQDETLSKNFDGFREQSLEVVVMDKGASKDIEDALKGGYDIITYIGTIEAEQGIPSLRWGKSLFPVTEIIKGSTNPPRVFCIGNLIQQQKIRYYKDAFEQAIPFMEAGSNFLTNFITLSREDLVEFFVEFFDSLLKGTEIAVALKDTRRTLFERHWGKNPSWMSFTLFGDEKFRIEGGD